LGKLPGEVTCCEVAGMRDLATNHSDPAMNKIKKINAAIIGRIWFADPKCSDLMVVRNAEEMECL
jgi:predicted secreted Zn-dependent protease